MNCKIFLSTQFAPSFLQLDLVCDDEYQAELTTTMYMVGATCGVVFLAPLGDKFGSKTLLLACLWAQAVVGTALIWAKHIIAFCIIKFLIGMCNMVRFFVIEQDLIL